jgi:RNA polymerase sigma-70 factor (ECF subfamily)
MRIHPSAPRGIADDAHVQRFERLFDENYAAVRAYALRRVSPDSVADVVQETFLVAWRRPQEVPANPLPWLLAVARRVVLREWRSSSRREALSARVASATPRHLNAPELEDSNADVLAAVERLPPKDREALALVYWDGLSTSEAATVLGCTQTALRVRLHRARRRLSALLETTPPRPSNAPLTAATPIPFEEAQ